MNTVSLPITTDVLKAADAIVNDHLCAIPTETVYGLAANARSEKAVSRVFAAKNRPADHPLIVHVASYADVNEWICEIPSWAEKLAIQYWPGPLTLVGKKSDQVLDLVTAGQDTVAVRVPAHPVASQLLNELKSRSVKGLVAPSANRFGHVSPTNANHVVDDLGDYLLENGDLILDGGSSTVGLESTIVLVTKKNPVILRPGSITNDGIELVTGLEVLEKTKNEPRVSGSLDSHYSPIAKVLLVNENEMPNSSDAGFIGLSSIDVPNKLTVLLAADNLEIYASGLYQALRHGDALGLSTIYAVLPTGFGLATAIRDRLTRAAD